MTLRDEVPLALDTKKSKWQQGAEILVRHLRHQPDASVFRHPVAWKDMGLHDYPVVIKHPMDLATLRSRLHRGSYHQLEDFGRDLQLIWQNAMRYNRENSPIHQSASRFAHKCDEWLRLLSDPLTGKAKSEEETKGEMAGPRALPISVFFPGGSSKNTSSSSSSSLFSSSSSAATTMGPPPPRPPKKTANAAEQKRARVKNATKIAGEVAARRDELCERLKLLNPTQLGAFLTAVQETVPRAIRADPDAADKIEVDLGRCDSAALELLLEHARVPASVPAEA